MKQCKSCLEWFEDNFDYFPKYKGRTYSYCKPCHNRKQKEHRLNNPDKYREQHNNNQRKYKDKNKVRHEKWRNENRDYVNQKSREWYANNIDKAREISKESYQKNRNDRIEYQKHYRSIPENKEKKKLKILEWTKNNVEKVRAKWHRYIARKNNLPNDFTDDDYSFALNYWNYKCAITGKECDLHFDHWIPLNSDNCPGTIPSNMIPIASYLNTQKQDKEPYQWLVDKFGSEFANEKIKEINDYFSLTRK